MTAAKIAELNDLLRTTFQGGQIMLTHGFNALSDEIRAKAMSAMREYNDFKPDNDPHREHDFGAFEVDGVKLFFKISYYDPTMQYGSDDPANPDITKRVLTLMLNSEW